MDKISDEKVNLPDGEYHGLWSAYHVEIFPKSIDVKTLHGFRGVNMPVNIIIKNNEIIDYEWK